MGALKRAQGWTRQGLGAGFGREVTMEGSYSCLARWFWARKWPRSMGRAGWFRVCIEGRHQIDEKKVRIYLQPHSSEYNTVIGS